MSLDTREESSILAALSEHAAIPIAFAVYGILEVRLLGSGLGGMSLTETAVTDPYVEDYDSPRVPDRSAGPNASTSRTGESSAAADTELIADPGRLPTTPSAFGLTCGELYQDPLASSTSRYVRLLRYRITPSVAWPSARRLLLSASGSAAARWSAQHRDQCLERRGVSARTVGSWGVQRSSRSRCLDGPHLTCHMAALVEVRPDDRARKAHGAAPSAGR
jgi:hypothetical protein